MIIKLDDFVNERLSSVVYHFTHFDSYLGMLEKDRINLTFVGGSRAEQGLNKNRYFFLSTQSTRNGGYGRRRNLPVMLVMDGDALNANDKGFRIDFWSDPNTNRDDRQRHWADENEERLVSDKPYLKPATRYIKEAHVFLGKWLENEHYLPIVSEIAKRSDALGIPTYFYQDEESYYNNAKSRTVEPPRTDDAPSKRHGGMYGAMELVALATHGDEERMRELVNTWADEVGSIDGVDDPRGWAEKEVRKEWEKLDDKASFQWRIDDVILSMEATLHNNKSSNNDAIRMAMSDLVRRFKKEGTRTLGDYVRKVYGVKR